MESIKSFFKKIHFGENTSKYIIASIGILIAILIILQIGMIIGFRKASFAFNGGDNYYRAFGPKEKDRLTSMISPDDFVVSHGAVGKVVKISMPHFIIQDRQQIEKEILINSDTVMRRLRGDATTTDLKLNDYVIVIGSPNQSAQVEAKIIRFVPPPGEGMFQMMPTKQY